MSIVINEDVRRKEIEALRKENEEFRKMASETYTDKALTLRTAMTFIASYATASGSDISAATARSLLYDLGLPESLDHDKIASTVNKLRGRLHAHKGKELTDLATEFAEANVSLFYKDEQKPLPKVESKPPTPPTVKRAPAHPYTRLAVAVLYVFILFQCEMHLDFGFGYSNKYESQNSFCEMIMSVGHWNFRWGLFFDCLLLRPILALLATICIVFITNGVIKIVDNISPHR